MSDPVMATMFQWTTDYAVGIQQIDNEHQRLFILAQRMQQAMLEGKGKAILSDLLTRLVDYTSYHFVHEEQLMQRIGYPAYREHHQEHEQLRATVRAMQDRAASGEVTMTIEVMQFLMEWLKRHTSTSDKRIGGFIKASELPLIE